LPAACTSSAHPTISLGERERHGHILFHAHLPSIVCHVPIAAAASTRPRCIALFPPTAVKCCGGVEFTSRDSSLGTSINSSATPPRSGRDRRKSDIASFWPRIPVRSKATDRHSRTLAPRRRTRLFRLNLSGRDREPIAHRFCCCSRLGRFAPVASGRPGHLRADLVLATRVPWAQIRISMGRL
jgi:hypothetical protein